MAATAAGRANSHGSGGKGRHGGAESGGTGGEVGGKLSKMMLDMHVNQDMQGVGQETGHQGAIDLLYYHILPPYFTTIIL